MVPAEAAGRMVVVAACAFLGAMAGAWCGSPGPGLAWPSEPTLPSGPLVDACMTLCREADSRSSHGADAWTADDARTATAERSACFVPVDGTSSVTTSTWPTPVSRAASNAGRRRFDRARAIKELDYPAVSTGGLNDFDRQLLSQMYYESDSVFEFGVGESTKIAVYTGVPRYTGVDGSDEWLRTVSAASPSHYRFHWSDIGATGQWSMPQDASASPKWPFYSIGALASEHEAFDVYVVDGRFRVACVCAAFLHAASHDKAPSEFRVAIHDFKLRHEHYADVLAVGSVVEGFDPAAADQPAKGPLFAVLRRRADVADETILTVWQKHSKSYG